MGSWSQPVSPDHENYCFFLLHFYQYILGFCFKLKLLFRNDETGIHWLPESILHVSEVTDDEVTCENGYNSYMYINLIAYFHHKKLLNDQLYQVNRVNNYKYFDDPEKNNCAGSDTR